MSNKVFVNKKAFTLLEIMIAMIALISILSISMIKYTHSVERTRLMEGLQILRSLAEVQMAYKMEHNNYSAVLADLYITIPALQYFNAPTVANNVTSIATIQRTDSYTLTINSNNTISCAQGASADANICTKLGF